MMKHEVTVNGHCLFVFLIVIAFHGHNAARYQTARTARIGLLLCKIRRTHTHSVHQNFKTQFCWKIYTYSLLRLDIYAAIRVYDHWLMHYLNQLTWFAPHRPQ